MLKQRTAATAASVSDNAYRVTRHSESTASGGTATLINSYPQLASTYPFSLNFYIDPPPYELTLTEFETFALDRLRMLKAVETANLRYKTREDVAHYIHQWLQEQNLNLTRNIRVPIVGQQAVFQERKRDHVGHFILRLAYCRTIDLRKWLVKQETALFMHRFKQEEQVERDRFIRHVKLDMQVITAAERTELAADLRATHGFSADQLQQTNFYRVPFEHVLKLVAKRRVFIKAGWAYVPERDQAILVANAFKSHLNDALEATAKALPRMDEDDRLVPVLTSISKQYLSKAYTADGANASNRVNASDVDGLVAHFPPCMRNLHSALRREAHLKHVGRLQLGLFLKGIGLPMEEALVFWRNAFHRMTDDQFQKGYAYNIRYNYGLEGKRTNYTPYSCVKIITSNPPGPQDAHGCPFRHLPNSLVKDMLRSYAVSEGGVAEIAHLAKEGHYQVACTKLFEATRGQAHEMAGNALAAMQAGGAAAMVQTIEHPNQWFDLSKGAAAPGASSNTAQGAVKPEVNKTTTTAPAPTTTTTKPVDPDEESGDDEFPDDMEIDSHFEEVVAKAEENKQEEAMR
ncbi:eukaryotic and archaeal DNA primase, large subunit-domain-containing protein [Fimicolochytrium jonesii]|uniref:eukaryotic and archaeal DNA primase, large subunit-domain-containing protein n=1 Tax=Fimicolochytrium jonesii TaxID=1396493 RepID=UPI0022FF3525|nr:eukaryotic and archaeal DNA primase, large subunit-domain-containing protein [Fimicolochytrium jonesii]KAI8817371.1 eukaryotic and archaeal DNA primase, large subunit-domain-containing protein [Fimicolochytrium jonesii]